MTEELTSILVTQARIEETLKSQNSVLTQILDQAKKTNGRVEKHDERLLNVDKELAENRGKAKVSGALWGMAGSIGIYIFTKLFKI
jgi:hypothetical protein